MTRLIDADALLEELRKSCEWHAENSRELSLLQRDINIVKEQPTVDAVPVRHGHWVGIDDAPHEVWECDMCGYIYESEQQWYNYCPNCGAKMEAEQDE